MSRLWLGALLVVGSVCLGGCNKPAAAPSTSASVEIDRAYGHFTHAQPRLPTVKVWLGDQELVAEVARRPVEIATGMMFRTNMTDGEAMLFVFPDAAGRSFYMRNCSVALSAGYIDPGGVVVETVDLKPFDETPVPSASRNIQFVLEVPQGWFHRHSIKTGAVVRTERGDLHQTFFGK